MLLFCLLFLIGYCLCDCSGTPNNVPIYDQDPVLVKTVDNGKRYSVGDKSMNSTISILELSGTDYQMGYAYGQLMKDELDDYLNNVFVSFFEDVMHQYIPKLPKWLADIIEKYGMFTAMDIVWMMQKPYVDDFILDILQGLSDGSGVSLTRVHQYNIMPSILHAGCTIIGAWGDAVDSSLDGKLIQVRALDLNVPIMNYPTIVNYLFDDDSSNQVSIISGAGYVGFLSGLSYNPTTKEAITYSEKVWGPFLPIYEQLIGAPWHLHMFQAMRYGLSVDQAYDILDNEKRTSSIYIGIGSSSINEAYIIEYAIEDIVLKDSKNQTEYTPGHPYVEDMIYLNKHEQPSSSTCTCDTLQKYHGKFTSEVFIRQSISLMETGDLQSVVYDLSEGDVYIANGICLNNMTMIQNAFDSQYVKIGIDFLFP